MSTVWTVRMWSERCAASSALAVACEQVGAKLCFRADTPETGRSLPAPALLAAVLPAGERSLPAELVQLLDTHPDLCLLLLCEEALVRPTLTIQEGRIVLLEAPLTASRIEARLRLLMTARCAESSGNWSPPQAAASPVPHERFRTADYWFAVFMGAATAAGRALSWRTHARHGLSWSLSEAAPDDAAAALLPPSPRPGPEDVGLERGLRSVLGLEGALVQLDPNARQWRFLVPGDGSLLRVFSHQRLPRAWDAGRALTKCNTRLFRLAAAPGDVVCLTTASLAGLESTLERSALDGGGPALFQTLVTHRQPSAPQLGAGVVVEVL